MGTLLVGCLFGALFTCWWFGAHTLVLLKVETWLTLLFPQLCNAYVHSMDNGPIFRIQSFDVWLLGCEVDLHCGHVQLWWKVLSQRSMLSPVVTNHRMIRLDMCHHLLSDSLWHLIGRCVLTVLVRWWKSICRRFLQWSECLVVLITYRP